MYVCMHSGYICVPFPMMPVCGACETELYVTLFPTPAHEIAGW